ncbi:imm11 family protein [Salinimicrobium soli]|uniref:imm11 family protein n=1 Tax=Salinimicrobium soli TaxID=1254399 RepID=UPI003AAE204D
MTPNFYFLTTKNYPEVASAFAPDNTKLSHQLIPELDEADKLPFELNLVKISVGTNGLIKSDLSGLNTIWLDLQPNSLAWYLVSEKLRDLINRNLKGNEHLKWISAVINNGTEKRIYYIPRFEKKLDVLDEKRTMYVKGTDHIINPCFSLKKIRNYAIFHKPDSLDFWRIPSGLYIDKTVKEDILKNKLTGVEFEQVRTA